MHWIVYLLGALSAVVTIVTGTWGILGNQLGEAGLMVLFSTLVATFLLVVFIQATYARASLAALSQGVIDLTAEVEKQTEGSAQLSLKIQELTHDLEASSKEIEVQAERNKQEIRRVARSSQRELKTLFLVLSVARRLNERIASLNDSNQSQRVLQAFSERLCEDFSSAYRDNIGIENRVCIKQVNIDYEQMRPYAKAIARSNKSDLSDESAIRHYVDANTDFRVLNLRDQPHWFCGDIDELVRDGRYESTSQGTRAYNSTIVWPIFARGQKGQRTSLRAFFCIDSPTTNAFKRSRDVDMGWVVVDALARAYERMPVEAR